MRWCAFLHKTRVTGAQQHQAKSEQNPNEIRHPNMSQSLENNNTLEKWGWDLFQKILQRDRLLTCNLARVTRVHFLASPNGTMFCAWKHHVCVAHSEMRCIKLIWQCETQFWWLRREIKSLICWKSGSFTQQSSNEEVIVFEKCLKKLHDFVAMHSPAFETVAFECGYVIENRCMAGIIHLGLILVWTPQCRCDSIHLPTDQSHKWSFWWTHLQCTELLMQCTSLHDDECQIASGFPGHLNIHWWMVAFCEDWPRVFHAWCLIATGKEKAMQTWQQTRLTQTSLEEQLSCPFFASCCCHS